MNSLALPTEPSDFAHGPEPVEGLRQQEIKGDRYLIYRNIFPYTICHF